MTLPASCGTSNPRAAERIGAAIVNATRLLPTSPRAGVGKLLGVRRLVVGRYPYPIYYTVDEAAVDVIAVRHALRRRDHQDS